MVNEPITPESEDPDIKLENWKNYISAQKVNYILNTWKWESSSHAYDSARAFVSKFDFDGDGRINVKEFILCMIVGTKSAREISTLKCQNCMNNSSIDLRLYRLRA
jgi:hypothetical protein